MRHPIVSVNALPAIFLFALAVDAYVDDAGTKSFHFGFMHPNGVNLVGYSVEKRVSTGVYAFYTFGFPSLAAAGLSYYAAYEGSGLTGTVGVGIGSVLYGAIAYQIELKKLHYLKIGAGLTTSIVYNGAYPVLSYEKRF